MGQVHITTRGWGEWPSLQWTGDLARPDAEIITECEALLDAAHDVDRRPTYGDLIRSIQAARRAALPPTTTRRRTAPATSAPCSLCHTYCCGDCEATR